MVERTDEELMTAYLQGDQAAFSALFQRYTPLLLRVIGARVGQRADAWDILQQTFLQLHRARLDFRPGARLRPYLMTICVNLCKEHFRRRGRRREAYEEVESPVAPQQHALREQAQTSAHVQAALGKLPEAQREVIALHWLAEMPFPEIAASLGLTVSAVKVRAHRGYLALRKLLGEQTV